MKGVVLLQHQKNIAEFMKKKEKKNEWQKDWQRHEIAERPRSKVIACQSCQICEITKHLT